MLRGAGVVRAVRRLPASAGARAAAAAAGRIDRCSHHVARDAGPGGHGQVSEGASAHEKLAPHLPHRGPAD